MGDREVESTLREKARQRSVRRGLGGIVEQHNTSSNKDTQARYVIRSQEEDKIMFGTFFSYRNFQDEIDACETTAPLPTHFFIRLKHI